MADHVADSSCSSSCQEHHPEEKEEKEKEKEKKYEMMMLYGAESGWVEPRTSCDHLLSLSSDLLHIPPPDTPCHRCQHPTESWLCLCCKEVFCSRFVNKHMLEHYHQMNHSLALSYSDLSVWCFACDAYLDAEVIPQLRPAHETAYILKFGEAPPLRIMGHCQLKQKEATSGGA